MKRKKRILAIVIASLSLVIGLGVVVPNSSQAVNAKSTVSHTVPKKFRGSWYSYNADDSYTIQKYTKNKEAFYTSDTKPYYHKVTVRKYNKNKYLIYPGKKMPKYRQYLSIKSMAYNNKKIKALVIKEKGLTPSYYFNRKIKAHYSPSTGEFYK
ncbi:hypothetical protein OZX56_02970 [Lactobacillus sp. ESL0684]|uniref:hypothetical protein n=1 Tax=Lactobacillus sp. ESL0684 TaxID=2983213 RepID=UPI0023F7011B|nr:hypothetical protein [Lactobacillus sp. ESL0684]WEV44206.1 hypothetical protein OZX56_02970 [Lactobacillus sp. ESL0684]